MLRPRLPLEWFAALALALALVGHSAFAMGGKTPETPEATEAPEAAEEGKAPKVADCSERVCVGDVVIDVDSGYRRARVISILARTKDSNGYFQIEYLEESSNLSTPFGFNFESRLAKTTSGLCRDEICVGDLVYDTGPLSSHGVVIGITFFDGHIYYVVKRSNGSRDLEFRTRLTVTAKAAVVLERQEVTRLEQEGAIDRAIYDDLRRRGKDHAEALEAAKGPLWLSLPETPRFLQRLSLSVYSFDREYFSQISALVKDPEQKPSTRNAFVMAALLPHLRAFGYPKLKERCINGSVRRIEDALSQLRITKIHEIESTATARRTALQMLGISLTTGMPQMSDSQRAQAAQLVRSLSEIAAGPLRYNDMGEFFRLSGKLERLLLELAQNPYLQGRVATDMTLVEYLNRS